jgi:hypothetical protein
VEAGITESRIHAVERLPPQGRCKPVQFIPIRFTFFNKLTKDDRLLVAFDALVLSEVLGRNVSLGKIIHGDNQACLKVKIPSLLPQARKIVEKIAALVARRYVRSSSPPPPWRATRGGPPTGISLTIAEPANQAVRPAYAKLERGLLGIGRAEPQCIEGGRVARRTFTSGLSQNRT